MQNLRVELTNEFINSLKDYPEIKRRLIKTIRGQALAGDLEGAQRGLGKVLRRTNR